MIIFKEENINFLYPKLIEEVFNNGVTLKKQSGIELKELLFASIEITNPEESLLTHSARPYNMAFMAAENIWNLCGDTDEWLCKYNSIYHQYFKEGKLEAGYGNRIFNTGGNQFNKVIELLKKDIDNSHCTISVFDKEYDLSDSNFVPCINTLKFRVYNNKLYMITHMRAQDLWKGLPYDLNLLISIFKCMSIMLGIEMGSYHHICDSIRLYKEDYKDVNYFLHMKNNYYSKPIKIEFGLNKNNLWQKLNYYKDIISGIKTFDIHNVMKEPYYWRNMIISCQIYNYISDKNYTNAYYLLNKLDIPFRMQLEIWSKRYSKKFYYNLEEYLLK